MSIQLTTDLNLADIVDFDKIFNTLTPSNTFRDETITESHKHVINPYKALNDNDELYAFINTTKHFLDVNTFTIKDSTYIYKAEIHTGCGNGDFSSNFHTHNPLVTLYLIGNSHSDSYDDKIPLTRDTHHLNISAVHSRKYIEVHSSVKLTELTIYFDGYYLCSKLRNEMCKGNTPESILYAKNTQCIACIRTGSQLYVRANLNTRLLDNIHKNNKTAISRDELMNIPITTYRLG
jgi:hypothetical protein